MKVPKTVRSKVRISEKKTRQKAILFPTVSHIVPFYQAYPFLSTNIKTYKSGGEDKKIAKSFDVLVFIITFATGVERIRSGRRSVMHHPCETKT